MIKRYDIREGVVHQMGWTEGSGKLKPREDICGEYVLHSDHQEALREKDELIQQLVDAVHMLLTSSALKRGMMDVYIGDNNSGCAYYGGKALELAATHGFKPTQG